MFKALLLSSCIVGALALPAQVENLDVKKVENIPCDSPPGSYCPDGEHCCPCGCCPDGLLCDCARGTCDTASGTNMAMKSFVQMMNEPIKPVVKKVENIPCDSPPGSYCPDGEHCCCGGCCPDGLLCDCARGTCDTASGTNMAMKAFLQMMVA